MKNFQTKHIFSMSRILNKIGLKSTFQRLTAVAETLPKVPALMEDGSNADEVNAIITENNAKTKQVGIECFLELLGTVSSKEVEAQLYDFLADIFETDSKSIAEMDPFELIKSFTEGEEGAKWRDFFIKVVALVMKTY